MSVEDVSDDDINSAKLFLHYEANDFFIESEQIMNDIKSIESIPVVIAHGRYDAICTFSQAHKLHKALPNSKLVVLPQSNHKFSADGEVAIKYIFDSFLKGLG